MSFKLVSLLYIGCIYDNLFNRNLYNQEKLMTYEQALQVLDQAVAQLKITRQEHQMLVQALEIVKEQCEKTKQNWLPYLTF